MTDDLIARVERQLSGVVTVGSGTESERTGRQFIEAGDIEALVASVRALKAQAALDGKVIATVDVACPDFWRHVADVVRHDGDWPEAANHLDEMADALEERDAALAAGDGKGE